MKRKRLKHDIGDEEFVQQHLNDPGSSTVGYSDHIDNTLGSSIIGHNSSLTEDLSSWFSSDHGICMSEYSHADSDDRSQDSMQPEPMDWCSDGVESFRVNCSSEQQLPAGSSPLTSTNPPPCNNSNFDSPPEAPGRNSQDHFDDLHNRLSYVNWSSRDDAIHVCIMILSDVDAMTELCSLLYGENILRDFICMLLQFIRQKLPVNNLPFILSVERSKFQDLSSSTLMRFRDDSKRFWATLMQIGRGRVMQFMGGRKSSGNVLDRVEQKGNYSPDKASINFIVPSRDVLVESLNIIPKRIKPGFIPQSFAMLDKSHEHILMFDAKKVAPGLGDFPTGDVNLLGLEGPPNLKERLAQHNDDLSVSAELKKLLDEDEAANDDHNKPLTQPILLQLIGRFSTNVKHVLVLRARCQKQIAKLQSYTDVKMPQRYDFAISNEKGRIHLANNWLIETKDLLQECNFVLSCLSGSHMFTRSDDTVDLTKCGNFACLHSTRSVMSNPEINLHPSIIKQRSDVWYEMRENAVVTGSTAWSALGLRGLAAQRKHFKQYVTHLQSQSRSTVVTDQMQHGIDNELNAVATCVTTLMPSLLPPCYIFREFGSIFIKGHNRDDMICVSPDGIMVCRHNEGNDQQKLSHMRHKPIVVEIKCPYPEEGKVPVHFEVPGYYALQLILEMKATKSEKAWYISYSKEITTLIEVSYDEDLAQATMEKLTQIFDKQDIDLKPEPTNGLDLFRKDAHLFLKNNSKLINICPSKEVSQHDCTCRAVTSPYHIFQNQDPNVVTELHIPMLGIAADSKQLLTESFQILREKGQEILAGVITDSDRSYNPFIPSNMPVVYGLKSYSLPAEKMREFVELTRDECLKQKVNILCEAFDGQWAPLVFRGKNQQPLTRMQLQRQCWNDAIRTSKKKIVAFFLSLAKIEDDDLRLWSEIRFLTPGKMTAGNIEMEKVQDPSCGKFRLFVSTPEPENDLSPTYSMVKTPSSLKSHHLTRYGSRGLGRTTHDVAAEMDINDIIQYLPQYLWDANDESEGVDEEAALDLSTGSIRSSLGSDIYNEVDEDIDVQGNTNLLKVILTELRKTKFTHKYTQMTDKELYFNILSTTESIARNMTVLELNAVSNAIKTVAGRPVFGKAEVKSTKVNRIGKLFGDPDKWFPSHSRKKTPPALRVLAGKKVMGTAFPKVILSSAYANVLYCTREQKWEEESPVPLELHVKDDTEPFHLFCIPERSDRRLQLEPRIIDPTHILNNVRSKICRSGIDAFSRDTVNRLARCNDKLISSLMITQLIDQQNAEISVRFFSAHVESKLRELGEDSAAEFVQVFRNWYMACDARGIDPLTRIRSLITMHRYLMRDYTFDSFPPPGRYFKGIPVQTVEAILHNCSMRIILYSLSRGKCICHRAISTLGIENWYSEVSHMDYSGQNCPKACQLDYLISHVISLNHTRNDPDKNFFMHSRKGVKYAVSVMKEKLKELQKDEDDIFKFHLFDVPIPAEVKKRIKASCRTNDVFGQEVGVCGLRQMYYKNDTSKIDMLTKLGVAD